MLSLKMIHLSLLWAFAALPFVTPALVTPRQSASQTAHVNLAVTKGKPQHVASGFIYGIPDNYPNQIPLHWYTDMGIHNCKGGGAQLGNVGYRGWVVSKNDYQGRFQSLLTNYKTCRAAGGEFSVYVHDLWGTDHANSNTHWPGDNGDWSDYDAFLKQALSDVAANMDLAHVTWDVWNEPDISIFWKRSTQQWVDMYIRTHKTIRANSALANLKISGPAMAFRPQPSNTWWTTWLKGIASNNAVPDLYTYHLEGGLTDVDNDPQYTNASLRALLKQYGLPERQVFANEYAESSEMVPGGYIWWISRLERYDFLGMLGNWLGGTMLHDLFGGLLTKRSNPANYAATDYAPAAGYPVYKYYNLNMTGVRANTTGSSDRWLDTYATIGSDKVRVLAGVKVQTGTWAVTIEGLAAVGYTSGSVPVQTYSFDGQSTTTIAGDPTNRGTVNYSITNGAITIPIHQTAAYTGWAFEFPVKAAKVA